jgi:hypothetical protein
MAAKSVRPLLSSIAWWCVGHMSDDAPLLVGVVPGEQTVELQHIDLCPGDPIADLAQLAAPASWEAIVVVWAPSAVSVVCQHSPAVIAHALDRRGNSHTEFSPGVGSAGGGRILVARLDTACRAVLGLDACVL